VKAYRKNRAVVPLILNLNTYGLLEQFILLHHSVMLNELLFTSKLMKSELGVLYIINVVLNGFVAG
jgi:hypothetical protein